MMVDKGGNPLESGPAQSLGDTLRNTRVAAGASIEQVEADLRIKAKYLEAIEDGDTASLPSRAYTDGFLRNYATYLGLDPADAVRRFASDNGLEAKLVRKPGPAPMKIKHTQGNPLSGLSSSQPRRSVSGSVGRGIVSLWPLVLLAGLGFGGYTGYVAARDAGLLPPELGGIAKVDPAPQAGTTTRTAEATPAPSVPAANVTENATRETAEPDEAASSADAPMRVATAEPELVGSESAAGDARPDSLSYARTGATPYWRAKPPAVEPTDGPVSEIEPETAGLLRSDDVDAADERRSRWSSAATRGTAPTTTGADASRIAAAAREALFGGNRRSPQDPPEAPVETASVDPLVPEEPALPVPFGAPITPDPFAENPAIGPIQTAEVIPADVIADQPGLAAEPQSPRRFALIAAADTWVQVQDAIGTVTYTGILSAGEAYNIPNQQGLRLKTGNAGGLFIEVDGQRFGPLGSSGAVMRNVVLDPGAVRASFTLSRAASLSQQ